MREPQPAGLGGNARRPNVVDPSRAARAKPIGRNATTLGHRGSIASPLAPAAYLRAVALPLTLGNSASTCRSTLRVVPATVRTRYRDDSAIGLPQHSDPADADAVNRAVQRHDAGPDGCGSASRREGIRPAGGPVASAHAQDSCADEICKSPDLLIRPARPTTQGASGATRRPTRRGAQENHERDQQRPHARQRIVASEVSRSRPLWSFAKVGCCPGATPWTVSQRGSARAGLTGGPPDGRSGSRRASARLSRQQISDWQPTRGVLQRSMHGYGRSALGHGTRPRRHRYGLEVHVRPPSSP